MFCVDKANNNGVNMTLLNSINKGNVSAETSAYGIANNITSARNVVSMGSVTGKSESFTFWNASTDVDLFYGMKDRCVNCSAGATLFEYDASAECFVDVSTHRQLHLVLSYEALEQDYGMMWTNELELVNPYPLPSPSPSQSGPLSGGIQHAASWLSIGVSFVLTACILFTV